VTGQGALVVFFERGEGQQSGDALEVSYLSLKTDSSLPRMEEDLGALGVDSLCLHLMNEM
jgi:hypothetical protein